MSLQTTRKGPPLMFMRIMVVFSAYLHNIFDEHFLWGGASNTVVISMVELL